VVFAIRKTNNIPLVEVIHSEIMPFDRLPFEAAVFWLVWNQCYDPVGYCALTIIDPEIVFLSLCGLLPEARGNGLQKRMITVREKWARRNGYRVMITYVLKSNPHSYENLIKRGFMLYIPEYEYIDGPVFYFKKDL
jgi:GNAT superfamily N-acetyltransferase